MSETTTPDDISVRYHEALIAAARGDKDQAVAALEALLANPAATFPERAEAETLLKLLKG